MNGQFQNIYWFPVCCGPGKFNIDPFSYSIPNLGSDPCSHKFHKI
jgi:hypothetical protein